MRGERDTSAALPSGSLTRLVAELEDEVRLQANRGRSESDPWHYRHPPFETNRIATMAMRPIPVATTKPASTSAP